MKKIIFIISALLFLSFSVLAEEHADAALEHANAALVEGKRGNDQILAEHAIQAVKHAELAAQVAKGPAKAHMESGVTHLHEAIKQANAGHGAKADQHLETAMVHIKAGNK
ncbi:MAG: small metal-binding protein SmbP [Methylomonas sp.]|jgi:hypothetical protein